jgi:hypothetical protein
MWNVSSGTPWPRQEFDSQGFEREIAQVTSQNLFTASANLTTQDLVNYRNSPIARVQPRPNILFGSAEHRLDNCLIVQL